jgi:hypothetical protein
VCGQYNIAVTAETEQSRIASSRLVALLAVRVGGISRLIWKRLDSYKTGKRSDLLTRPFANLGSGSVVFRSCIPDQ